MGISAFTLESYRVDAVGIQGSWKRPSLQQVSRIGAGPGSFPGSFHQFLLWKEATSTIFKDGSHYLLMTRTSPEILQGDEQSPNFHCPKNWDLFRETFPTVLTIAGFRGLSLAFHFRPGFNYQLPTMKTWLQCLRKATALSVPAEVPLHFILPVRSPISRSIISYKILCIHTGEKSRPEKWDILSSRYHKFSTDCLSSFSSPDSKY